MTIIVFFCLMLLFEPQSEREEEHVLPPLDPTLRPDTPSIPQAQQTEEQKARSALSALFALINIYNSLFRVLARLDEVKRKKEEEQKQVRALAETILLASSIFLLYFSNSHLSTARERERDSSQKERQRSEGNCRIFGRA